MSVDWGGGWRGIRGVARNPSFPGQFFKLFTQGYLVESSGVLQRAVDHDAQTLTMEAPSGYWYFTHCFIIDFLNGKCPAPGAR